MDKPVQPTWPVSSDPLGRKVHRFKSERSSLDYMTEGDPALPPLVLLQSLEYPGWPGQEFCTLAEDAGFRTVSVRRPGFGSVPSQPNLDQQVALIGAFLDALDDQPMVVATLGTSNTFGYRLARHPKVKLLVLSNCCFNYNPLAEIQPDWFAKHMEQTLTSEAGARLALMGLKSARALFGKFWVVESFMQKSAGDLEYLRSNRELFAEAADCVVDGVDIHTFIMELRTTLKDDIFLQDGCFNGAPVIAVSGEENSDRWKTKVRTEAERVGVPLHFFPSGDALVIHQCAGEFLDLVQQHS
jgi:pimeloyl-ACP methyl ester carboxylesterase